MAELEAPTSAISETETSATDGQSSAPSASALTTPAYLAEAWMKVPALIAIARAPDLIYEFANDAFRAASRLDRDPVGQPIGFSSVDFGGFNVRAAMQRVIDTGEPFGGREVLARVDRNGVGAIDELYFDMTFQPVRAPSGHLQAVIMFATEVTESVCARKRVEAQNEQVLRQREALRKSEAHLRAVVDSNMIGILFWDSRGAITEANDAFLTLVGYDREDLVTGQINWLTITPAEYDAVEQNAHAELAARGVCTPFEKSYIRKDGRRVPILIGGATIGEAHAGGVAFVVDLSHREQHERELRAMQAKLLEVQKLESLGVLAGGIAHDFNNLLTGIMGNASVALLELDEDDPVHQPVLDILATARRAADLTRQLLAYSGKGHFDVRALDLSSHVGEIAKLLETTLPKKVKLSLALGPGMPAVRADVSQVQQVVMNLVINGAEAIGDARGVVTVTTGVEVVDARAIAGLVAADGMEPGTHVFVEVSDSGAGMDAATRARIFDPFFTTKFTGRGLGLAAVLGIVRGHRGGIRIRSEVGVGTTFRVYFPATTETAESRSRMQVPRMRGAGVVLVIDDEPSVRGAARRALEQLGFEVLEAAGGRQGIDIYRADPDRIAAVLLDMTMPDLSGEETVRELCAVRAGARVILSSGYSDKESVAKSEDDAVVEFLHKPYTPDELADRLRAVLAR